MPPKCHLRIIVRSSQASGVPCLGLLCSARAVGLFLPGSEEKPCVIHVFILTTSDRNPFLNDPSFLRQFASSRSAQKSSNTNLFVCASSNSDFDVHRQYQSLSDIHSQVLISLFFVFDSLIKHISLQCLGVHATRQT